MGRVPGFVRVLDPVAHRLLKSGVPMGPNALITVRGRKSGLPRTTAVAMFELDGHRWTQGAFGEVDWVRNLRAAGEATLTLGKRQERVRAVELTAEEAAEVFTRVFGPEIRRFPPPVWWLLGRLLGIRDILEDPAGAARRHPVFELVSAQ